MAYVISETCMLVNLGLTRGECASWVQAWGSILAIVVAILVVVLGHGLQQRARRQDEEDGYTRSLEHAYQVVDGAAQVARNIIEFAGPGLPGTTDRRAMLVEVTAYCDAIQRIDTARLRTFTLVRAVLAGDALARILRSDIEDTLHPTLGVGLPPGYLRAKTQDTFEQLHDHSETIAIAIRARRGDPRSGKLITQAARV